MKPTDEQQNAIDLFATRQSLAIEALAGSGKTSTLEMLAHSDRRSGQYIAFNKSIVTDAETRFPQHVRCNTAHSLAFRAGGFKFAHRLKGHRMPSWEIAAKIGVDSFSIPMADGTKTLDREFLAGLALRTVRVFCRTADREITTQHVPYVDGIDEPHNGKRGYTNNEAVRNWILPAARKAWGDISQPHGVLPFDPNVYLKMWQLGELGNGRPQIKADYILYDESQDANGAMIDIVEQQTQAQRVWVGDQFQEIMAWNGAVNALSKVTVEHRAYLTQSFRFGQEIADVANEYLALLGTDIRIKGNPAIDSTVGPIKVPECILARTNASTIRNVIQYQLTGERVHLVGGDKSDTTSFVKGAKMLIDGGRSNHPDLACFETWGEVCHYAENDELGSDLRMMVTLVNEFGVDAILHAISTIVPENKATVVVSTAHKAKGRQWGTVQIADDFPDDPSDPELKLLYVAVTRPRYALDDTLLRVAA